MHRSFRILAGAVCSALLISGCGARNAAPPMTQGLESEARLLSPPSSSPIKHIIVLVQENRSVDNFFNGLPGADTVTSGLDSHGQVVQFHKVDLVQAYDLGHGHKAFEGDFDNGQMDGFNLEPIIRAPHSPKPPPDPEYAYVPQSQVQPYFTMAETYAFADRMFQTNSGGSFPAHLFIGTGTAAINGAGIYDILENGYEPDRKQTGGCDSPPGTLAVTIDLQNNDQSKSVFPCVDHKTLWDELDKANLSWRWYQPRLFSGLWFTPDAFRHIRYGPDYANVITPNTKILRDIRNNRLPAVSWVIPTGKESDHPDLTDGSGPAWVAKVVNTVGKSKYWDSTAIFITWDDWGGWYDHVAPQQFTYDQLGFRVPLVIISPYAKPGYVSHVQHEFGSILHFMETTFGLPSLGYTDARADDLSDIFDYSQKPIVFKPIPAPPLSHSSETDTSMPDND